MDMEDYIKRMDSDISEVKKDVKALMMFMAIEQERNKKSSMVVSGLISLVVSLVALAAGRIL